MENKNLEFILKKEVSLFIKSEVEDFINNYYKRYSNNLGFLLYYPLITLEKNFFESGLPEIIQSQRVAISWFIKELMKKGYAQDLKFSFNDIDREKYETEHHINILEIYKRKVVSEEVQTMNPTIGYEFGEIVNNTVEIKEPYISNEYDEKIIYHFLLQDEVEMKSTENLLNYIHTEYSKFPPSRETIQKLVQLPDHFDENLYNQCEKRVVVDLEKLGGNIRSAVVRNLNELKNIITSFFYICQVKHMTQFIPGTAWCLEYNHTDLIDKIREISGLSVETIKRYIDFLTLDPSFEGTITHFPLARYHGTIIIIPSSFLLNDFHFNIVNGHYHKGNIQFTNRNTTISKSIVNQIIEKAKQFPNILSAAEVPYTFTVEGGKVEQSDIDVALFDKNTNNLLIIECKWIDNHFTSDEERYIKVYNTLRDVYNDQIHKHFKFLSLGQSSILHLFANNPIIQHLNSAPSIHYVVLDKRSQFHYEDKHMVTVYLLLYLFKEYSNGDELQLDSLINKVESFKTNITFSKDNSNNKMTFELKGLKFKLNVD